MERMYIGVNVFGCCKFVCCLQNLLWKLGLVTEEVGIAAVCWKFVVVSRLSKEDQSTDGPFMHEGVD